MKKKRTRGATPCCITARSPPRQLFADTPPWEGNFPSFPSHGGVDDEVGRGGSASNTNYLYTNYRNLPGLIP